MRFFTGLHQPSDARHFEASFVSVARLRMRKADFIVGDWIMDSGAFTEVSTHGRYRHDVKEYARQIRRWKNCGNLLAAVAQDWMCEPHILERTAKADAEAARTSADPITRMAASLGGAHRMSEAERAARVRLHQDRTIERYDALLDERTGIYILPVLQGFKPEEYVNHVRAYGERLTPGMWVGVGSVCKRNGDPRAIEAVLLAIKRERPDLRLHGFGLKTTALSSGLVRSLLETADSMAWSYAARKQGRNANDWREALAWTSRIATRPMQHVFDFLCTPAPMET